MSGQVHHLINKLIETRANGNAVVASTTKTKLLLKGIKVQDWTPTSSDDPAMLKKIRDIAVEMGIAL